MGSLAAWNWPLGAQRKQDLWLLWNASGLVQHSSCQYEPCVFIGNMCQNKTAFEAAAERRWASPEAANLFFCLLPKIPCRCCPWFSNGRTDGKHLHSKEIVAIQVCTNRKISYTTDSDAFPSLTMLFPLRKCDCGILLYLDDAQIEGLYYSTSLKKSCCSKPVLIFPGGAEEHSVKTCQSQVIFYSLWAAKTLWKLCKLWILEPLPAL